MKASLDISMYPLDQGYEKPILDFIHRLQKHKSLTVKVNSLSTHIFGDYDEIMAAVTQEMRVSFEREQKVVMVLKILNDDRSTEDFL